MTDGQLTLLLHQLRRLAGGPDVDDSDGQLLARFTARRDEGAFAELVRRHGPMVLGVCRRVLGHAQDAEDAFQATFLVLARKAGSIRRGRSLAGWLYQVAYHLALRARHQAATRRVHEREVRDMPQADAGAAWRELLPVLDEEVQGLPQKYREPLVLCYLQGKTQAQAARELGQPAGSMSRHLAKALELLRERLAQRGVSLVPGLLAAVLADRTAATLTASMAAATARAALAFVAGNAGAAGGASAKAAALAEGALQALFAGKVKAGMALALMAGLLAGGMGVLAWQGPALNSPPRAQHASSQPPQGEQPMPAASRERARVDRYGDPLPTGAVARLGTVRLWHGSQFNALVYAPDGKTVAACGYDSTIRLWDTTTGKEVRQFQGQKDGVLALAFSPDGKLLASAGWGDLMVWRLDRGSGKEIGRLLAARGVSDALAFAPGGKFLASATDGHVIRLWAVDGWREVRQFAGQGGKSCPIVCLGFLPDGTLLASCKQDKTIRLWDVATGKRRRLHAEIGKYLSTAAISPDGKRLAAVEGFNTLLLWDTATGKQISRFTGPKDSFYCIAFSSDSRTLAASGLGGEVCFWDTATGKKQHKWASPQFVTRLAFAPNGNALAVGGSGMIRFREAATGKDLLPLPGHAEIVTTVAFAPDGKSLRSAGRDGVSGLWDPATGKPLAPLTGPPSGFSPDPMTVLPVALSRDSRKVAAVNAQGAVQVWDRATGKAISRFGRPPGAKSRVAFSPDGQIVAASHQDRTVRLWDTATGKQIRRLGPLDDEGYMPTFSPDGKVLAVSSRRSTIRLWDTATGKAMRTLRWQSGTAACLTFSADGKLLAAGQLGFIPIGRQHDQEDTLARVWDLATGLEIRRLQGTSWYDLLAVTFSPDGRTLAAGTHFRTIHLWEMASGRERSSFHGHGGEVEALDFSPDGRLLASASTDQTGLVWDVTGLVAAGTPRAGTTRLPAVAKLWDDLAGADARGAYQAVWRLAAMPEQTISFLKAHLRPAPVIGPDRIAELIADLNSDRFAVRERAMTELAQLGATAEPALRRALAGPPLPEVRRRAERLLEQLHEPVPPGGQLQALRAVEVLEHAGTPEARQVLAALAHGAAQALLTQEAKMSLERLHKRATARR